MKLTLDEELQAKEEGWKLVAGYPASAYNAKGICPFYSTAQLTAFLRHTGKESELHRRVYMSIPWTSADDSMALDEGWRLASTEILTVRLTAFPSNEDAQAFVQKGIEANDPLHIKAISTLAKRRLIHGE
jgi:hypothetical protein